MNRALMPSNVTDDAGELIDTASTRKNFAGGRLEKLVPLLIFVCCCAYLCLFLRYSSVEPDEGIVLQGAERVLHGQVPYRDFFSFYTPGSFYFLSLWFDFFGDSLVSARISIAITGAICSVMTYLLARRACSRGSAVFVALLGTTAGTAFRFLVLHNWYSTLLSCLAIYAALLFLETGRVAWGVATSFLASLTVLFEQSKGSGLCIGLAIGFLILRSFGRTPVVSRLGYSMIAVGFAAPVLATFGYLGAQRAAESMLKSWFWPLQHYARANHVPYGFQNWTDRSREVIFHSGSLGVRLVKILAISPDLLLPVLPVLALFFLVYSTLKLKVDRTSTRSAYYVLVSSTTIGLVVSVVASRADILHFVYLAPLLYVVLGWILQSPDFSSRLLSACRPYLIAYIGVAFGLLSMALLSTATGSRNRIVTRRGTIVTGGKDSVIAYIQTNVGPGDTLLVYPYLPLYNYLTETHSPSHYDYFQPGMNTPEQAREIISSLKTQPAVLFEPWFTDKIANSWPGTPLTALTSDAVSDYLARNYRVCAILTSPDGWRFHYMVSREESCP